MERIGRGEGRPEKRRGTKERRKNKNEGVKGKKNQEKMINFKQQTGKIRREETTTFKNK